MRTTSSFRVIVIALLLFGIVPIVNARWEQALYIDGKVRTEGLPLDGTRILVERDGIMVQELTDDIGRIRLRLDLQSVYILSFERVGCMTKILLFDTHVPVQGLMSAPFSFPFKVTLEENKESAVLHYTQPVGFIRYYPVEQDFGYDTDYRMRRYPQRDEGPIASTVAALGMTNTMALDVSTAGSADPDPGTPATAMVERRAPVEVLAVRPATPLPDLSRTPATKPAPAPRTEPVMRPVTPKAEPTKPHDHEVITVAPRPRPAVTRVIHIPRKEAEILPDGRTEELQVERNSVTTTVRITKAGYTREFRRVAHRYGAVHYFFNGNSCSEATYTAGINE